uniref:Death domain-containing protein n=1 Tax=Amphimedon queenslandica TaxID=400682 RepID=A0A1X7TJP8_AMPQE
MNILLSAGASYNTKEIEDVPDISELNIGPMIDDRPDYSLLIQWLKPLVDWKPFGDCLPEITDSDISKIEKDNPTIDEQKSALYSKWLKAAPKATWADVINALSKRREKKLVQDIRRNLQKSRLSSATGYAVTTKLPSQTVVRFHISEDEKEILRTLIDLKEKFSILMMHVRFGFQEKTEKDPNILHTLTKWVEAYMHWDDKLTDASLDKIFKILYPFYDFIDCSPIVDISEEFLQDFKFGDNELSIVSELRNYKEKADKLRFSAQVRHLHESLKTIYEEHIPDASNMPVIVMKLHNQWHGSTIHGLSLLINHLLPVGHQQSIIKYMTIVSGCILIKYFVHGSKADSLIEYTGGKLQFMHLIGIFRLYINDHPVLQEEENMNFTFELALLEAVTAETVNIDHTNEEGRTALMLACERGHEDIVHSLLSAGVNVNIQDNKGWIALMRASEHNHNSIIHMLLQANANPDLKTSNGSNAVMIASYHGNYEVVELLISKGVDYKCQREDGMNAFMLACQNGHTQVVELLLKEQVDPNVQRNDGVNAFMLACQNGHTQIVELLLKEQVDPNIQNGEGVTALMIGNAAENEVVSEWIADPTTRCNECNSLAETAKLNLVEA